MKSALPLVVLVALLAGCAGDPAPAPEATTPPAAGPSATPDAPDPQPVDLSAPEPLLLATCSELVDDAAINALTDTVMKRYEPWEEGYDSSGYGIRYIYTLRQAQATLCGWSDSDGTPNNEYSSFDIAILPHGESAWAKYAEAYRIDGDHQLLCHGDPDQLQSCSWEGLSDGYWLSIRHSGMKYFGSNKATLDAFTPVVRSVKQAVAESETGEVWVVPSDTLAIENDCPSLLTEDVISTAFELKSSKVGFYDGGIGGTGLEFEAASMIGAGQCLWSFKGMSGDYGNAITMLPGGQWAWDEARGDPDRFFSTKEIALAGLADGDEALIGGGEYWSTVDLLIGRNWIHISVYKPDVKRFGLDREDTLMALAQGVIDEAR